MADVLRIDALDEAKRIVGSAALLEADATLRALLAELERLRAIEAALDADAAQGNPCVLCGSYGPVSLVANRRGSFWLCDDAAECRARKGGAK